MTTTLEQFREQCAKTIELFDDATMRESDYMLDAHECADIIRALPLPVMPEQAEPVAKGYARKWYMDGVKPVKVKNQNGRMAWPYEMKFHEITPKKLFKDDQPLFAQDPSVLLARIAELEAENQKLKELSSTDELLQIGKLLRTQDNRCTDQPVFEVQRKRWRITEEGYGEDRVEWRDLESDYVIVSELRSERLEAVFQGGGDVPDRYQRNAIEDYWEHVTSCFTKQGCEDHIAADGHNLGETRIYANGSYRNFEYRAIRNWLMSLPEPVSKPE